MKEIHKVPGKNLNDRSGFEFQVFLLNSKLTTSLALVQIRDKLSIPIVRQSRDSLAGVDDSLSCL